MREIEWTGRLDIRSFILRRLLRTWPLYTLFLFLTLSLSIWSLRYGEGGLEVSKGEWIHLMTFSYNFIALSQTASSPLPAVTWSLSVEEQIYLIFPLYMYFFGKYRFATMVLLFLSLCLSFWFALSMPSNDMPVSRLTSTFIIPTAVGLILAQHERQFRRLKANPISLFLLATGTVLILVFVLIHNSGEIDFLTNSILISCCFLAIFSLILQFRIGLVLLLLAKIGRVSYGCYLYHWLYWNLLQKNSHFFSQNNGFSLSGVTLGLILTVLTATISYKYYEKKFLKLRQRFQIVGTF